MRSLLAFFLLFALNQARITIPLEKVHLDSQTSYYESDENPVSRASAFLSSDSMKLSLFNVRNYFYFGNIFVGSNNQTMKVLFDTGSNDLWLATPSCKACLGPNKFDWTKSKTCKKTSTPGYLSYGLGEVSGSFGSDMIGLTPSFRVESRMLLVDSGAKLTNYYLVDGFIGLGSKNSAKDFIDLAYDAGQIDSKVFSIHLDINKDATGKYATTGTYMTIGYVPEEKINNMVWIPVTVSDRWATDILSVKIGDSVLSSFTGFGTALFDTGASFMYISSDVYSEFQNRMKQFNPIFVSSGQGEIPFYPCQDDDLLKYPNVSFSVSGLRIDVTPFSYLDLVAQVTQEDDEGGQLYCRLLFQISPFSMSILGDAFLKENFVAYSKLNQTIGINLDAGHQVLPNPNPPLYAILIQVFLMIIIGAFLLVEQKKRLLKTALAVDGTLPSDPNSTSGVY